MKTAAFAVIMLGLFVLCGCGDSQLVQCQNENAALKAEVQKAQTQAKAADDKIAEMRKKDRETQTEAMASIMNMLEKEATKSKEKDAHIKQLEAELTKLKTAAESK